MASGNNAIVQVKGNQASLLDDCKVASDLTIPRDVYEEQLMKKRGRLEKRRIEVYHRFKSTDAGWEMIAEMVKVQRYREVLHTKEKQWKSSHETAYYVSTGRLSAQAYNEAIRNHWRIENCHHHVRDQAFQEDRSRIRINPGKMARLRSWALNILRFNNVQNISKTLYENSLNINKIMAYKTL